MSKTVYISVLTFFGLLVPNKVLAGTEWSAFHGPARDNKSAETGLLKTWPEGGPKLLWTTAGLGKGYSSVTVAGGRIYTAGKVEKQTRVFCLDMDGKVQWQAVNGDAWEASGRMRFAVAYDGSRSTPTIDRDTVYHLGELGRLAAFNALDGKERWSVDFTKSFGAKIPKFGFSESVLIHGEDLICCPGSEKAFMVALDKKTGNVRWRTTGVPGTVGYSSAVLATIHGVEQVLAMGADVAFGVERTSGTLLWQVPCKNQRSNNATDITVRENLIFLSTGYGKGSMLVKLKKAGDAFQPETVWENKKMDNHHGGVILLADHVYGSGHKAKGWACLELMTGKETHIAPGKGSITFADDRLYCLDEKGLVTLVQPLPAERKVVGSFQLPEGGKGAYWAHPVVCDGRLYLRHNDRLFAYDIKAD